MQIRPARKRDFLGLCNRHSLLTDEALSSHFNPFMLAEQHADRLVVRAPAKVNLFLELLGKRSDGYHELLTLMVAVDLFDILEFTEAPAGEIALTCDDAQVPAGPQNLATRAAELLLPVAQAVAQAAGRSPGVRIRLSKRIPVAAGLAGGSSDAAATLVGLNRLWGLRLGGAELARLGARLGSDVPFFLGGPAAWCSGRGEIVTPTPLPVPLDLVIACPPVGLATADVYRQANVPAVPRSEALLRQGLERGEIETIGAELFNRLQAPAERLCPEVAELRRRFEALAVAGHAMSGSGSAYFALCRGRAHAEQTARMIQERDARLRVFVTRTLSNDEGHMANDARLTSPDD